MFRLIRWGRAPRPADPRLFSEAAAGMSALTLGQMGATPDLLARRQNGDRRRPAVGDHVQNRVSEGGLEPPCPFGALAPQASASAYSATRTGCWGPPEYGGSPASTLPNGHLGHGGRRRPAAPQLHPPTASRYGVSAAKSMPAAGEVVPEVALHPPTASPAAQPSRPCAP